MSNKKTVIHAGEGVVADVKWRGNYIVWANDTVSHACVRIYQLKQLGIFICLEYLTHSQ